MVDYKMALEHEMIKSCKDKYVVRMCNTLHLIDGELDENDYLDVLEYVLGDLDDIDRDLWDFCDLLSSYME